MAEKVINNGTKDSFNRFDDNLCEGILRYLPLSDCFRLQCVSKQFNALIFNGQTTYNLTDARDKNAFIEELLVRATRRKLLIDVRKPGWYEVNSFIINKNLLDYILGKCVNINRLVMKLNTGSDLSNPLENILNNEILSIVSNNCKCLKHFTIEINANKISLTAFKQFAEKSLKNIESLSLNTYFNAIESNPYTSAVSSDAGIIAYNNELFDALFPITTKLKSIQSYYNVNIFEKSSQIKQYWNQIDSLTDYHMSNELFIRFSDNYSHQIKSLTVVLKYDNNFDGLKHLSDFKSMEYLYCDCLDAIQSNTCAPDLIGALTLVGSECTRLRVLGIDGLRLPFFGVLNGGFKSLQKLIVRNIGSQRFENFALLTHCTNLTHLELFNADILTASFDNIHKHLPQLKSFSYDLVPLWYREILKHLQRLPNLYELKIQMTVDRYNHVRDNAGVSDALKITTKDVITFISNCKSIRKLVVHSLLSKIDKNVVREYITKNNRKIQSY